MIEQTVAELLDGDVGLDTEGIDRLYLNLYQPRLQTGGGVVAFFKGHRGAQVASTTLMAPMTRAFAAAVQAFAKREGVEIVNFVKGQRKDDETQRRLKDFHGSEGVLYIGTAQELGRPGSDHRNTLIFMPKSRQNSCCCRLDC